MDMSKTHQEFWGLAEQHGLPILILSQLTSAPIKILLEWLDTGNTPDTALQDLKRFLSN